MSKIRKMVLFLVQYFLYTLYTSSRFHVPHYWIWTSKEDAKNCQNTSTASVTSVHYISLCQIFTQKSFGCKAIFYSPLHFCSFERTWPSWIIRYSWFCCPCMRCEMSVHQKNGGELMNIRCDFFSSYPFFFMLHLWAVCQKLRNAPGYFEFSRNQNNLERLLPQMKEMSTNKKSNTQRVRS